MRLTIKGSVLRSNRLLRRSIVNQVYFTFSRFSPAIVEAEICLEREETSGRRVAFRCTVVVQVSLEGAATVEAAGDTAEQALSDALGRMQRLLSLRLFDVRQV